MARPIKKRNAVSYQREIEQLYRLRAAILLDLNLDMALLLDTISKLDILINSLSALTEDARKSA